MNDRKQYSRELRKWYIDAGICPDCGARPVVEGETRCLVCKMDNRERTARWQKRRSEKQKRAQNALCNEHRTRLKVMGICVDCGKRPVENGRKRCGICLAKDRARHKQRNIEAGKIPHELRGNGVYCHMCCKPLCHGEKLCPTCYEKACNNMKIASAHIDRQNHPWRKLINADVQRVRAKRK